MAAQTTISCMCVAAAIQKMISSWPNDETREIRAARNVLFDSSRPTAGRRRSLGLRKSSEFES